MRVVVRSSERCIDCGLVFSEKNQFYCAGHRRAAERVFLDITGKGSRNKIYSDVDGNPLHRLNVFSIKDRIAKEISNKTFDIRRYLPRDKNKYLFGNYKEAFQARMKWRTTLPHGNDDWLSQSAYKEVRQAVEKHFTYFDEMDIVDVRRAVIQDWLDQHPGSKSTKKKLIGVLRQLLRWAHEREDLQILPKFPEIRATYRKKRGIDRETQDAILAHIPPEHRPIFEWAMETGRRINEYRATKIRDIDLRRGVYRIGGAFDIDESYKPFPKIEDHAEREFPLTARLIEVLGKVGINRETILARLPDDWVFVNPNAKRKGGHYMARSLFWIFATARGKAELPNVTLNEFARHSMAYQLINSGATMEEVAMVLDNTPDVAAKNYAHLESHSIARVLKIRSTDSHGQNSEANWVKKTKG